MIKKGIDMNMEEKQNIKMKKRNFLRYKFQEQFT